jgi:hypothetical protein
MLNELTEHNLPTANLETLAVNAGLDAAENAELNAVANSFEQRAEQTNELTALDVGELKKKIKGAIKSGDTFTKKSADAAAASAYALSDAEACYAEAGTLLIEAKARVRETGENWGDWVFKNCKVDKRRADALIELAEGRTTASAVRANANARQVKHRESKKAVGVTSAVTPIPAPRVDAEVETFDLDKAMAKEPAAPPKVLPPLSVNQVEAAGYDIVQRLAEAYGRGYEYGFADGQSGHIGWMKTPDVLATWSRVDGKIQISGLYGIEPTPVEDAQRGAAPATEANESPPENKTDGLPGRRGRGYP